MIKKARRRMDHSGIVADVSQPYYAINEPIFAAHEMANHNETTNPLNEKLLIPARKDRQKS